MANIKGTPGPWKIKHSESKKAFNIISSRLGTKHKIARIPYECEGDLKLEAASDAKLIAAAPELLEALQKILSNFKSCIAQGNGELESDKSDIQLAENAIKKATKNYET